MDELIRLPGPIYRSLDWLLVSEGATGSGGEVLILGEDTSVSLVLVWEAGGCRPEGASLPTLWEGASLPTLWEDLDDPEDPDGLINDDLQI